MSFGIRYARPFLHLGLRHQTPTLRGVAAKLLHAPILDSELLYNSEFILCWIKSVGTVPELPEVETVCRGLAATIIGKQISSVWLGSKKLRRPFSDGLVETVEGCVVTGISRRAKYALIHLANSGNKSSPVLIVHLGMSGKLLVHQKPEVRKIHDHAVVEFHDGAEMVLNDARRFGCFVHINSIGEAPEHDLFINLGFEPFDENLTASFMHDYLVRRKQPIKLTIMDQAFIVGVGNIYASEALFRAGISPLKASNSINIKECAKLLEAIRAVLREAIDSGGSTLRDYVRSNGDSGYFQHNFAVYDRENQPCVKCKSPIQRIVQGGRTSYYCLHCQ